MRYERPKTRSEWVYALLKEKILSGQYQPLERLVADQIGRELGTSVIPIREALQRLESDGLVEIQPYVGARVAAIAERDLEELFEIRKRLEPLLARSAVAGVTPAALSQLERICAEMDQAIEADDMFAYSRKNWEFHESIYRLSPWKTRHSSLQQRQIDAYLLTPPTTFQAVSQGTACPSRRAHSWRGRQSSNSTRRP